MDRPALAGAGVTAHNINTLHTLDPQETDVPVPNASAPTFAHLLADCVLATEAALTSEHARARRRILIGAGALATCAWPCLGAAQLATGASCRCDRTGFRRNQLLGAGPNAAVLHSADFLPAVLLLMTASRAS